MTSKTRKRIWPVGLAMSIGIIGVLAAFLVVVANPATTQAHDPPRDRPTATPAPEYATDVERADHDSAAQAAPGAPLCDEDDAMEPAAGAPMAPTGLTTSDITSDSITLTWAQTDPAADTFEVEVLDSAGAQVSTMAGVTGNSYMITGLSPITTYTLRVRGMNSAGDGAWAESTATTLAAGSTSTPMPSDPIEMISSDDGCGVIFHGDYDLAKYRTIEVRCQVADVPGQDDTLQVQFQKSTRIDPELQAVGDIVFTDYRSADTQVVNEPEFMRDMLDAFDDADESADAAGTQISVPDDPATELIVPNAVTTSDGTENGVQISPLWTPRKTVTATFSSWCTLANTSMTSKWNLVRIRTGCRPPLCWINLRYPRSSFRSNS